MVGQRFGEMEVWEFEHMVQHHLAGNAGPSSSTMYTVVQKPRINIKDERIVGPNFLSSFNVPREETPGTWSAC